jgi:GAF domain-containing protein
MRSRHWSGTSFKQDTSKRVPAAGTAAAEAHCTAIHVCGVAVATVQLTRLHLLNDITRAIGERQDLASIFQVVVRTLEEQLPLEFCCVCLYDAAGAHLTISAADDHDERRAIDPGLAKQTLAEIGPSGLSRSLAGQLVYEPDLQAAPLPFPRRMALSGLCAMVAAPLLVESKVFGVLIAARRAPNSFAAMKAIYVMPSRISF